MKIVNDYHMHTKLSPCSGDQEATIENFVRVLAGKGFKSICITDHYWTLPENIWENRPDFKGPFPETLKQIPENKKLAITRQADGSVSVTVERLEIHTVLQVLP